MNKGPITFGIVCSIILIGLGVYGLVDSKVTNENLKEAKTVSTTTDTTVDNTTVSTSNETLTCSTSEYQETYSANCITEVVMTFKNKELYNYSSTIVYQYTDAASYQKLWGSLAEKSGSSDADGLKASWSLDDSNLRYTIIMNANIDDLKNGGWKEDNQIEDYSYESMRQYFTDQGIECK